MNTEEITNASQCFCLINENKMVGFIAILHQPHGINKKIKRCSRLVILPEYQGIGLGGKFLEWVAKYYVNKGFDFSIKTSAKNIIGHMRKSDKWLLSSYGKSNCGTKKSIIDYARKSLRKDNRTYSFFYKKIK